MRVLGLAVVITNLIAGGNDSGVPPRAKPSDYPVHEAAKTATLAAAIVPPDQVRKMFTDDVSKGYIVVEVAIYPENGRSFEVDLLDFSLKSGDRIIHADKPRDVSQPWPEKTGSVGNRGPAVTTETGVVYGRSNDPVNGRRTTVGTYEGVGVSNYPRADDPAPSRKPDPSATEEAVRRKALPEGKTAVPVAGYLFFQQYGRRKKTDAVVLNYSRDDESVDLHFPQ
jgi:hypothetical protein